jgi:hypothetical protein
VGTSLAHEVLRVGRDGHDVEPGLIENAHDARTDQRLVLTDNDAQRGPGGHWALMYPTPASGQPHFSC